LIKVSVKLSLLKDEPLKIGWQQPIVGWSETPTSRLNLTDTFINALVRGKHHPYTNIYTPAFVHNNKSYRISDKFSRKRKRKAIFPNQGKVKNGKEYQVTLPVGNRKIYDSMRLPNDVLKINKKLAWKQKISSEQKRQM
jgi:hypothetical protein